LSIFATIQRAIINTAKKTDSALMPFCGNDRRWNPENHDL